MIPPLASPLSRSRLLAVAGALLFLGWAISSTRAAGAAKPDVPAAEPRRAGVERVIVVFKTHFDIGYTDLASNVVQRYRTTMIDDALQVVDRSHTSPAENQFVWTLSGWPMAQILADWPGQTPTRHDRTLEAFRQGRFVVHALPFTTHTELLELEDLVRGMGYSSRLSREAGILLPRDAKMTDVPCHSWILPTLLRHAGVDFLHLGCNAASRSPDLPTLFWWEGPDGSRLLTFYTAESYGTGLTPPADWPYRTWLALIHTGDNHGPPTPEEVQSLLTDAHKQLPGVTVQIGRLADFADAVRHDPTPIPVVRGDMPDSWIHGPMSDPLGGAMARRVRPEIATLEALNSELALWGVPVAAATQSIAAAYDRSLLYGEHTWGGALYWVAQYDGGQSLNYGDPWKQQRSAGRFARLESSWAEHSNYIAQARDLVEPQLRSQLEQLARSVKTDGRRVVVYNPLPWRRDGVVELRLENRNIRTLQPADGGEPLPVEATPEGIRFVAHAVPPMGYRTYQPVIQGAGLGRAAADPGASEDLVADPGKHILESPEFRVVLDPQTGCIRSLVDRTTGREWVDPASPYALGQVLYERFDRDQVQSYVDAYVKISASWATNELGKPNLPPAAQVPYRAVQPSTGTTTFSRASASISASTDYPAAANGLPFDVRNRVVLYRDLPVVDLEITLTGKPADPWPEAGWICLPFRVQDPRFQLGRLGSIVDPARDLVPGSNHHLYGLTTGLLISDPSGLGIGLCPLDSSLVSLDVPGCWKYSRDFRPARPTVFVNLFNNQWTTNFRLWNEGTWTSRVRLWSATGGQTGHHLVTPSLEARQPLLAAVAEGSPGPLPPRQDGLELSRHDVQVCAFGSNPDGPGSILRLWELSGRGGPCQVRFPAGFTSVSAQPVTLRGEPVGNPIPIRRGLLDVELRPFAPISLAFAGPGSTNTPAAPASKPGSPAQQILEDEALNDVLARARELLKSGFNAGSGYQEVWIRDFATFIDTACDVTDRQAIRTNLLMFFRLQGDDGNIVDGFVPRSKAGVGYAYIKKPGVPDFWGHKNTVETDQETSLIQAVRTYIRKTGDTTLLAEMIDGKSVLDRMEWALEYLMLHRFSKTYGLIWGATTVDWGDVQPEHEWGVELDRSSHLAIDVYDNAMLILALRDFIAMAGPESDRGRRWQQVRDQTRRNLRQHLWDPRRQRFLPHLYLAGSPFPSRFDEADLYYHGGTAVAILAGVLARDEALASLQRMRANVKAAGAGSIGLTVYPPYPAGYFKNPSMRPWSYQNGGDWDWFGGRMIQGLIELGYLEEAYAELQPMVRRIREHDGFYEWWDRDNKPQGSATFRGSAGVLARAIVMLQEAARQRPDTSSAR